MIVLPRVYPILDTTAFDRCGCGLIAAAGALLDGGAGILQIRNKGHWSRTVFAQAEEIVRLCRERKAIAIVNDRADIAMLLNAGLHVGQDDLPAADARRLIGRNRLLGLSTHNEEQLAVAAKQPIDYIAIGPIFSTTSKVKPDPVVGTQTLGDWLSRVDVPGTMPIVAIGGITRTNAREAWNAGADSVAIIGDLLPEICSEKNLKERMEEWRALNK